METSFRSDTADVSDSREPPVRCGHHRRGEANRSTGGRAAGPKNMLSLS